MKRKTEAVRMLFYCGALLMCLGAVLYPLISNYLYNRRQDRIITEYGESIAEMDSETLEMELNACREYNRKISQTSAIVVNEEGQTSYLEYVRNKRFDAEAYEKRLNLSENGVMGYIVIPRIKISLPVRHYTSAEVLESGVGHLPESSLPVGGQSTHAVLAGHAGNTDKNIFTDLEQLRVGDLFCFSVLGETLVYEVDQILTVLPYETDELLIVDGEDLMTLVTCTPYGINSHRLLVRGRRVEIQDIPASELSGVEEEELGTGIYQMTDEEDYGYSFSNFLTRYVKALLTGAGAAVAVISVYLIRSRRQ